MRLGAAWSGAAPGAVQVRGAAAVPRRAGSRRNPVCRGGAVGRLAWGLGRASSPGPAGPLLASLEKCLSLAHFKTGWLGFCCFGSSQYFGS